MIILKSLFKFISFPFRLFVKIFQTIYNLISADPKTIEIDLNELPPNAKICDDPHLKIKDWYLSRKNHQDVEDEEIYQLLADILPEGKINFKHPLESHDVRTEAKEYSKNPFSYSINNKREFTIRIASIGPSGFTGTRRVDNPRAKTFRALPYEKITLEDPFLEDSCN